jgi:hypothetical protein
MPSCHFKAGGAIVPSLEQFCGSSNFKVKADFAEIVSNTTEVELMSNPKAGNKQATILRTFRLGSSLDAALAKNAARKKIGKNALVVSILSKYVDWDSIVEDFGYLTVPPEMVAYLLGSLDKDKISSIASQIAKKVASSLPLWFGSADFDGVIKYMEHSVKYTGARLPQRIERQGSVVRIITYQPFSENGAAWVRAFNTTLVKRSWVPT